MVLEKKFILLYLLILVTAAIFGFLTWPNFTILKPWGLIMLRVKFDNNWWTDFREKVVWSCLNMLILDMNWSKIMLVNRK